MPRSHVHVLIAEDNETNLEVCRHFLRQAGIQRIDNVRNGLEALRKLEIAPNAYDLVLMDVNMPEMDGISATREILRRWPDPAQRPPIVALTAHAFVEETRRCLDAGMDACLSKPLRPHDLEQLLALLLGGHSPASVEAPAPAESSDDLVDWVQFDMIVDDPTSPCVGIFLQFAGSIEAKLREISQAAMDGQSARVGDLCHQLKGTAASFGLVAFTKHIKEAELMARGEANLGGIATQGWIADCLTLFDRSRDRITSERRI
ncbi:MAG: response regulator [Verrucomicrobiae bacterium]|nr:response regulator [Verrucomicrobiae bacterium]